MLAPLPLTGPLFHPSSTYLDPGHPSAPRNQISNQGLTNSPPIPLLLVRSSPPPLSTKNSTETDTDIAVAQHVTNCFANLLPGCDKDSDEMMTEQSDRQQMVLRSVTKNHQTEKVKKGKVGAEETLIDSDGEDNLVIDCDVSSEEIQPAKASPSMVHGKLRERNNMLLRQKTPNSDVSEKVPPSGDDFQEPDGVDSPVIPNRRKRRMKMHSRWYKTPKIRKENFKRSRKPLKRMLQRTKLKAKLDAELPEKSQPVDTLETENVAEKNVCPICQKEFLDSHSFTLHIREHNTDKLSHICQICNKQLSSASSLDRHMYVHSGERPFECNICNLRFTTNGNMHRHMKIHDVNDKSKDDSKGNKRSTDQSKDHSSTSDPGSGDDDDDNVPVPKKARYNIFESSNKGSVLKCPVCGKRFSSANLIKSHMTMHSSDPIKCSTCNVTLENYTVYEKHSCSGDNGSNLLNLPKMGFHDLTFIEFSSSKFPFVAKQRCEKQCRNSSSAFFAWECHKCAKAFPSNQTLYQHELSHENGNTSCYTCKCDFSSTKNFHNHQLKHRLPEQCSNHVEIKDASSKEDFLTVLGLCTKGTVNENKRKSCENFKQFDSMQYFVHGGLSADNKGEESENDFADIKSIISLTSNTVMPDMRASPVTASPASPPLAATGDPPTSPIIEGSANPSDPPTSVEEHSNSSSPKLEDNASKDSFFGEGHNCKKCSETFTSPMALKQHMRAHSRSAPLHQCNFCPYQSVDKSTLKRHMRKHNGEHPFKCSICDYVFTTKANGHRHVKNKHKLSEQEAADAVIYNPNMLEAKDSDGVLNESGNSETICKYCKVDFKYNRVLRHHLRSLNNSCSRKPYSCSMCKQGFSTKNNCIRHITNHHPESKNKAKELVIINEVSNADQQDRSPNRSEEASEGESMHPETQPLNLSLYSGNEESSQCMDQEGPESAGSDSEMVVAQSLVSLSELIPPQEKPLDLTLCALDLTLKETSSQASDESSGCLQSEVLNLCMVSTPASKENKSSSEAVSQQQSPVNLEVVPQPLNLTKTTPTPVRLVQGMPEKNAPQANLNNQVLSLVCLPPVLTPIHTLISKNSSIPIIYSTPKPIPVSTPSEIVSIDSIQLEENQKNSQKVKKFSCDICFKGFTLKSNRERHIKNHHPEHARPPRSRNYIPILSPTTVQKQSNSALSDRTRDALRVALIAKTNNNNTKAQEVVEQKDNQKAQKKLSPTSFRGQFPHSSIAALPGMNRKGQHNVDTQSPSKDKMDITDLASVSDVIDAVNCSDIKQYLLDARGASDSSGADEPLVLETEVLNEDSTCLNGNADTSEKKSSYAKCAKSIQCTYCKRTFPWKSSLSRHFLTHTGLKPHKCPKCPLSFTTKSNRDRHLFRQHSNMEDSAALSEKPYKCRFCPNSHFSTSGKLKKHFYSKHSQKDEASPSVENETLEIDCGADEPTENRLPSSKTSANNTSKSKALQEPGSDPDSCVIPLECHLCMNTFKAQEDLLSHLKEVHPLEVGAFNGTTSSQDDPDISSIIKVEPADEDELTASQPESALDCRVGASKFYCSQCSLQLKSTGEFDEHMKSHAIHLPSASAASKSTSSPVNSTKSKSATPKNNANSPKKTPSSLLYLFAAAQQARSSDNATLRPRPSKPQKVKKNTPRPSSERATGDDNSLILNLLGLRDPGFLDEMLDSAARSRIKKEKDDA